MILLSIDSSGKSAAAALTEDGTVIADCFENSGLTHSQTLLPLVERTLQMAGKTVDDVDAFALTNGPGSFTGLRIGCALVKGMAANRPCYPVSTLEALSWNLPSVQNGYIVAMMDARRAQVYTATFQIQDGIPKRIKRNMPQSIEQLRLEIISLQKENLPIWLVGDGAYLLADVPGVQIPKGDAVLLRATSIAKAAQNISPVPAPMLGLEYLRLSQAQREKLEREGNNK